MAVGHDVNVVAHNWMSEMGKLMSLHWSLYIFRQRQRR